MKKTPEPMNCFRCKCAIRVRPNAMYCDPCRAIVKKERTDVHSLRIEDNRKERLEARGKIEKRAAAQYKSSISDIQQQALNRTVDNRHAFPTSPCVTYYPGITGFAERAKACTQPKFIRRGCSDATTYIDAEPQGRNLMRRFESADQL
jgi:hypothetical protein